MTWFGQSKEMIQMFIDDRSKIDPKEIQNYVKFKSCSAEVFDIEKLRSELRAGLMRIMLPKEEIKHSEQHNTT